MKGDGGTSADDTRNPGKMRFSVLVMVMMMVIILVGADVVVVVIVVVVVGGAADLSTISTTNRRLDVDGWVAQVARVAPLMRPPIRPEKRDRNRLT